MKKILKKLKFIFIESIYGSLLMMFIGLISLMLFGSAWFFNETLGYIGFGLFGFGCLWLVVNFALSYILKKKD